MTVKLEDRPPRPWAPTSSQLPRVGGKLQHQVWQPESPLDGETEPRHAHSGVPQIQGVVARRGWLCGQGQPFRQALWHH